MFAKAELLHERLTEISATAFGEDRVFAEKFIPWLVTRFLLAVLAYP